MIFWNVGCDLTGSRKVKALIGEGWPYTGRGTSLQKCLKKIYTFIKMSFHSKCNFPSPSLFAFYHSPFQFFWPKILQNNVNFISFVINRLKTTKKNYCRRNIYLIWESPCNILQLLKLYGFVTTKGLWVKDLLYNSCLASALTKYITTCLIIYKEVQIMEIKIII